MMDIIIDVFIYLSYLLEGYITCMYFDVMFEQRRSSLFRFVIYITVFSLSFILYLLRSAAVNMISALVFITLCGVLCFYAKWWKALFHSGVLVVLLVGCETFVIAVFNLFFSVNAASINTPPVIVVVSIASKILLFMICKIIGIFAQKDKTKNKWTVLLFVVPVSSMICMLIIFNQSARLHLNTAENILNCIVSIMLLSANLLAFYVYERALKNEQELSQMRLSEQRCEMDYDYYKMVEEHRKESRIVIHDIKHHLNLIRCMAAESKDTSITGYIDSIWEAPYFSKPVIVSGNRIADTVLSQKILICEKNGIKVEFEHNNTDLSFVNDTDLCSIISNAMDNAIESAVKSKDKTIKVSFYISGNDCFCFLEFVNSCDKAPEKNEKGFMSKKKGKYHGIGLYSIKQAAQKYAGEIVAEYSEDKKFHTTVMLQVPKK